MILELIVYLAVTFGGGYLVTQSARKRRKEINKAFNERKRKG